jgi:hypothetical protein
MRIDGPQITGSFSLNGDGIQDLGSLVTTSSLNTYTSSTDIKIGTIESTTHSLNSFTSSATTRLNSIEGVTGSYATTGSNQFDGSQAITGSLTVTGDIIAQTLNVQQVTSSVLYSSGSNIFGNSLSNTHQFTGSLSVTGSLSLNGLSTITGTGTRTENFIPKFGSGGNTIQNSLIFDNGTSVGINNANPNAGYILDANGFIRATGYGVFSNSLNVGFLLRHSDWTGVPGSDNLAIASNQGDLTFFTNGSATERMRITSAGTLLIGTPNQIGRVQIRDTSAGISQINIPLMLRGDGDSNSNTGQVIAFMGTTGSTAYSYIGGRIDRDGAGDNAQALIFGTNDTNTLPVERMRITSGGNVGIGTTNPTAKLTVVSDATDTSFGQIRAVGLTNAAKMTNIGYHTTGNYGFIQPMIAGTGYSPLALNPEGGNVGIGIDNPAAPLTVRSVGATGILLEQDKINSAVSSRIVARNSSITGTIRYDTGGWRFNTNATLNETSGTERVLISTDGYLRMLVDSNGIQFNGDTAAANALDDYEEGTWTPTFQSLSVNVSANYSNRLGTYTKIGNMVYAFFDMDATSISGTRSGAIITGLPYTVSNSLAGYSVGQYRDASSIEAAPDNTVLKGFAERGQSFIYLQFDNTGTAEFATNSSSVVWKSTGGRITGYVIYQT